MCDKIKELLLELFQGAKMKELKEKINLDEIILFKNIRENQLFIEAVNLFNVYGELKTVSNDDISTAIRKNYFKIQRELLELVDFDDLPENNTIWKLYIERLLKTAENKYSLLSEKNKKSELLISIVKNDLKIINLLYNLDWEGISKSIGEESTCIALMAGKENCVESLCEGNNIYNADKLFQIYSTKGAGLLSEYMAFTWQNNSFVGVENYDTITFESLIGYEAQKAQLIENTEFLIKGKSGNNVLLFGDRGTGKSSSVKALLNYFKCEKLKLISVKKNQLTELDKIFTLIENRGFKFIIFIDDLSFEEHELEYKAFKSIIEGGLGKQPQNTLIYVTTNRRHLIRETWKDRSSELGDIHQNDGIQERTSLAERFGLTITYSTPNKNEYLQMIRELAKIEGLTEILEKSGETMESLDKEALKWEVRHNGPSGRTARQFINFIKSKKGDTI